MPGTIGLPLRPTPALPSSDPSPVLGAEVAAPPTLPYTPARRPNSDQFVDGLLDELPVPTGLSAAGLGPSNHATVVTQQALEHPWGELGASADLPMPVVDFSTESLLVLAVDASSDGVLYAARGPDLHHVIYPAPRDGPAALRLVRIPEPLATVRVTPLR